MANTLKQMLPPDVVEALTLDVPSGSHEHAVDPGLAKTLPGGPHKHTFRLPSGELLVTDLSGPHEHSLYINEEGDEAYTYGAGEHVHTVTLEDGSVIKTEIDGWHCHEINLKPEQGDGEADVRPDGQHRHRLVLPNGAVIMSLMPGDELMELATEAGIAAQRANMSKGYPKAPNSEGVAEIVVREKAATVRLTLGFDAAKCVVDLDVARKGVEVESVTAAAEGFGLNGYRFMQPIAGSTCKAKVGKRAGDGDALRVDDLQVAWGIITETSREVFLKGKHFTGTLTLHKAASGWTASFERITTPAVLTKNAPLPPKGHSALPPSLAKACPREFAYWESESPLLARQQRDALAVSGFFAADTLAVVDGEVRKVERIVTTRLYQPGGETIKVRKYTDEVRRLLPVDAHEVVVQKAGQHWEDIDAPAGAVRVIDGASIDELDTLHKCTDAMLVIAADAPETRRALEKHGRPFTLAHPDASGKVFAASMEAVTFVEAPPVEAPPVEAPPAAPESLTVKAVAAPEPDGGAKGTLRLLAKAAEDSDERYVLGIVLEPLTEANPDAQGDIYDAPTIKKAAHLYMERFQNVGLQHKQMVSDTVILVESYIAPVDMAIGGALVKAGTWMMAVRVDDDELWKQVKSGAISGFSIGGWATRTPVDGADQSSGAAA